MTPKLRLIFQTPSEPGHYVCSPDGSGEPGTMSLVEVVLAAKQGTMKYQPWGYIAGIRHPIAMAQWDVRPWTTEWWAVEI